MDYEKILKRIVQIINTTENSDIGFTNICTYIGENCPELQKSEDERIRKELIDYINRLTVTPNNIDRYNSWVTWLERQSNKAVISHRFNVGDWIISKWGGIYQIKEVMSGNYNLLCGGNTEEINSIAQVDNSSRLLCISDIKKLKEQASKPEWSEEDEDNLNLAIYHIRCDDIPYSPHDVEPIVDWLNSIKQRLGGDDYERK